MYDERERKNDDFSFAQKIAKKSVNAYIATYGTLPQKKIADKMQEID